MFLLKEGERFIQARKLKSLPRLRKLRNSFDKALLWGSVSSEQQLGEEAIFCGIAYKSGSEPQQCHTSGCHLYLGELTGDPAALSNYSPIPL